jgi:hypothetical protein
VRRWWVSAASKGVRLVQPDSDMCQRTITFRS